MDETLWQKATEYSTANSYEWTLSQTAMEYPITDSCEVDPMADSYGVDPLADSYEVPHSKYGVFQQLRSMEWTLQ